MYTWPVNLRSKSCKTTQTYLILYLFVYYEIKSHYILCPEYASVLQNGLPVIKWPEVVEDDIDRDATKVSKHKTQLSFFNFFLYFL